MFELRGRLISIGSARPEDPPRATILIREEDGEEEALSVDIDLEHEQAIEFAPHLFGYVKISIEKCDAPPREERSKGPRLVGDQ